MLNSEINWHDQSEEAALLGDAIRNGKPTGMSSLFFPLHCAPSLLCFY